MTPLDISSLDQFIYVWQAARELNCQQDDIIRMVEEERLQAALLPDGRMGVSLKSLNAETPREGTPEYARFLDLQGNPISINEASRRYGVYTSTLTRWMQRGHLHVLEHKGNRTLLDEADVAYCALVYKKNQGQGKRVLGADGKPYRSKMHKTKDPEEAKKA
jgi:hypothetical protein